MKIKLTNGAKRAFSENIKGNLSIITVPMFEIPAEKSCKYCYFRGD